MAFRHTWNENHQTRCCDCTVKLTRASLIRYQKSLTSNESPSSSYNTINMENAQEIQERLRRIVTYSRTLQDDRTFEQQKRNTYLRIIEHNATEICKLVDEDATLLKAKLTAVVKEQIRLQGIIKDAGESTESTAVMCKADRDKLLAHVLEVFQAAAYMKRILEKQLNQDEINHKQKQIGEELDTEGDSFHSKD